MVRDQRTQGRRCLLVIDEVQNLSLAAMEELRMLSNITVDGKASVQTILLGQPQFRSILAGKDWEQLRQRVLASYHLGPLTPEETRGYIEHRLRTVDWRDDPVWEDDAFTAVHRHTGGIPRRINTLCSRVLLLGALEESGEITEAMVNGTAQELQQDIGTVTEAAPPPDHARPNGAPPQAIAFRLAVLEQTVARRERTFRRLMNLLAELPTPSEPSS